MPKKTLHVRVTPVIELRVLDLPIRVTVPMMVGDDAASIQTVLEGTQRPVRMILDSGSFLSVVHSSEVPIRYRQRVPQCTVVGVCNMPMTYSEVTTLCFRIGGKPFYQEMAVLESLASPYILGNDFLKKQCVILDYFEKVAHIHWLGLLCPESR